MTPPQLAPPSRPAPSLGTVLRAAGGILAATVVVFGAVLALGLTVPAVRSHISTVLAFAIPAHAVLILGLEHRVLRRRGMTWGDLGFMRPTRRLLHLLWQIPASLLALVAVQGTALLLLGDNGASSSGGGVTGAEGLGPVAALAMFVGAAVLTPLWEEAFFRGLVFGSVRARWGAAAAIVISALVFAAAHGVPILLPYLVTMGFALGLLRAFHRNLWAGLALHMTVNAIASAGVLAALA